MSVIPKIVIKHNLLESGDILMKRKSKLKKIISQILVLALVLTQCQMIAPGKASAALPAYAYITNCTEGSVTVLDVNTNTVVDTIYGFISPWAVAFHPNQARVYISNLSGNNISVIDTETNTKITDIPSGWPYPRAMEVSPDGTKLYVVTQNRIQIIDTVTYSSTPVDISFSPETMVMTPDGLKIYLTNTYDDTIRVFDTLTNTEDPTPISVGLQPSGMAITPDGAALYVAASESLSVYVIDTSTDAVITNVPVSSSPGYVSVTPDGTRVYVSRSSGEVSVIDTTTNTETTMITVGTSPAGISVTPDGSQVYVVNSGSDNVSVINTATNTVTQTLAVGDDPRAYGKFIGVLQNSPPASPVVTDTYPPGNAIDVQIDSDIMVNFSELIEPGPNFSAISLITGTTAVDISPVPDGNLYIYPLSTLNYSTAYTVYLPAGAVQDSSGNIMESDYTFNFTTAADPAPAADTTPPTWPNGNLIYANSGHDSATLEWTSAEDPNGVVAYSVYEIIGYWEYPEQADPYFVEDKLFKATVSGATYNIIISGLTPETTYQFKVEAVDPSGNWSNDGPGVNLNTPAPPDTTPPSVTVIDTYPTVGVDKPVGSFISVSFSEPVNQGIYFSDISLKVENTSVGINPLTLNGDTYLEIFPISILEYSKTYTVTIPAGAVQDLTGNTLESDFTFQFTTEADPAPAINATGMTLSKPMLNLSPDMTAKHLTRAEAVRFIIKSFGLLNMDAQSSFTDVPPTDPYYHEISSAVAAEIISGYEDNTFQPHWSLTRAEFAAILVLASGYPHDYATTPFSDVPADYWAAQYIAAARDAGFLLGYPDGTFKPDEAASLEVYGKLIARITPLDALNKKIIWSSSDTSIATVDQTGQVAGLAVGSALITATTEDGSLTATCTVTVSNDFVNFPDTNLEAAVLYALNKSAGPVTIADLSNLTILNATNRGINDLTGLEYAINLKQLYLENNQITDLTPLANLISLEDLWLGHNEIDDTTISNVGGLTNLKWLYLNNNYLSSIETLSNLEQLQTLGLNDNYITDVSPLAGLTSLWGLRLGNNYIDDISDLRSLVNLQSLDLQAQNLYEGTGLTDISAVAEMPYLRNLLLNDNSITDLTPVQNLTNLRLLTLWNNDISDSADSGLSPLAGLSGLTDLWLDNNDISNVTALAGLTNLQALSLAGNYNLYNISSLINNSGLGQGDYVYLPTDISPNDIQALNDKNINVIVRGVTNYAQPS